MFTCVHSQCPFKTGMQVQKISSHSLNMQNVEVFANILCSLHFCAYSHFNAESLTLINFLIKHSFFHLFFLYITFRNENKMVLVPLAQQNWMCAIWYAIMTVSFGTLPANSFCRSRDFVDLTHFYTLHSAALSCWATSLLPWMGPQASPGCD